MEIGVFQGGSLQMWKDYFGPQAKIIGVDIDPRCKELEEDNIEIYIGSQSDRKFLRDLKSKIPRVDILLDDGGHTMRQQIVTFEELFDHVKPEGLFLCEDLHTSYFLEYGGGNRRPGTFIEYSKRWIDQLHGWFSEESGFKVDNISKSINSVHYYTSMVVVEKSPRTKPESARIGKPSFESPFVAKPLFQRAINKAFRIFIKSLNKVLRIFGLPSIYYGR